MNIGDTVTGWGPHRWTIIDLYDEATTWPCVACPVCGGGDTFEAARDCPRCDYGDVERYGPGRLMAHIERDTTDGPIEVAVYADELTVVTAPAHHADVEASEDVALFGGAA